MQPYNKYDISRAGVLDVFITKDNHQLSWSDLAWVYHAEKEAGKAKMLSDILEDLTNKRILEKLPANGWKIINFGKAQKEFMELTGIPRSPGLNPDTEQVDQVIQQHDKVTATPGRGWLLKAIIWIVVVVAALIAIYAVFK